MRIRSFRVPFSRVVPEDALELEFGPDDYLVVRPIFGLPADELVALSKRMADAETEEDAATLVEEVLKLAIIEWSLTDADGKSIPKPVTKDDMLKTLPGALPQAIYQFLTTYRGDEANPTTRS